MPSTPSRLLAAAAAALLLSAAAAAACARAPVPGAERRIDPAAGLDQALLDAAVLSEINLVRCRAGLRPLESSGRFVAVAASHSGWMARSGKLSHSSNVRGMRNLSQRIARTGLPVRRAAENIGYTPGCNYARRPATAHSYGSLARQMVGLWMDSPGHRRNILTRGMKVHGAAIAVEGEGCGRIWATQKFGG